MVKPLAVAEPLAGTEFSFQYEAALADVCRSAYRPVSANVTDASESRSTTWRTSPGRSPSSAAALAGSAAGIAPPRRPAALPAAPAALTGGGQSPRAAARATGRSASTA